MMLKLHREGHIELPPVRFVPRNPLAQRSAVALVEVDQAPLRCSFAELGAIELGQVRRTPREALFNSLMQQHHYLGYMQPVGEHLKYLVCARGRPIACAAWSSAPRHLGSRDRYIGWSAPARRANIRLLAYNTRFLILPWVTVPHLASHLLGRMARALSADWQGVYGHPIYLLETFVDPQRFAGACYRAANWIHLGVTTGRGKDDMTMRPNRPIKHVLGYPLVKDFRQRLSQLA
jgi:Druantia protein DruA